MDQETQEILKILIQVLNEIRIAIVNLNETIKGQLE